MNTIETLEVVLRNYYLSKSYCTNQKNWFTLECYFAYRNKTICIHDHSGKAETKTWIFKHEDTEEVINKAITHFRERMIYDKDDLMEINKRSVKGTK